MRFCIKIYVGRVVPGVDFAVLGNHEHVIKGQAHGDIDVGEVDFRDEFFGTQDLQLLLEINLLAGFEGKHQPLLID
jgi:hypothetical protein